MTKLIADIGATNARFALADKSGVRKIEVLACNDYETPADAALAYLKKAGETPETGAFAVACPLDGTDRVAMTNHNWAFSINETGKKIGLRQLKVINDFTALALSVPQLAEKDRYKIGAGMPRRDMPIAIIGPGTGLGIAGIVFADGKPVPITTEGGHVTMASGNAREFALFEHLRNTKYSHVSAERVISGKGLANIHAAIVGVDGLQLPDKTPAEVTKAALKKTCPACVETLDLFCHFLGVVAGNLALSYGAAGGVYIAGGIVPQLGDYFARSRFRESFLAKGRFRDYLDRIPTYVITHPYPGLEGLKGYIP